MEVGKNISKIRIAQNLSVEFVAGKLNRSVEEYKAIEEDKLDLTLRQFEEIANVLSVTVIDILQYDDNSLAGIKNYFYNHNGNAGVNIQTQGIDQEQIRKSYRELYVEELNRIPKLEKLLKENNIEFTY